MASTRHSRYWKRFLLPGETLKHAFGVSDRYLFLYWILPLALILLLAIVVMSSNAALGAFVLIAPLGMLMPILYLRLFIHYAITDKRVLRREGILRKKYVTVQMNQLTDISVREKFFERLITKTGTIGLNTAGSPWVELHFRHVMHPFKLREDIYNHQAEVLGAAAGSGRLVK